jgi:thiol:disulfide interchange protein DsbD
MTIHRHFLTFASALTTSSASALAAALALASPPAFAQPVTALVKTEQVQAELVAHAPEGVVPGKPLWLGLKLQHQPEWHTYWKNPGDSGLPTTLAWTLPSGFTAGEIAWPTPKPLPVGPLVNFGYEGTLLLPVPVTVPAGFTGTSVEIKLHADWLICKDVCIPEAGDFILRLPAQAATAANGALFDAARAAAPQAMPGGSATAELRDGALAVRVAGLPAAWHGKPLHFMPETPGVIDNGLKPQAAWNGGVWEAKVALSPQRSESPLQLPVVLVANGAPAGVLVAMPVTGSWPALGAAVAAPPASAKVTPAAAPPGAAVAAPSAGLATALLFTLVGGALLNLMPCVFPILSLKVIGFTKHAHDRRALLAGGMAYTAGVMSSFVALAALLLALRAGGEQLGWGFQLQSPIFVALLAALFTLIGLNLAGVFEFGSVLPASWGAARARHPLADSALTGVLAVAVASPCTAPFMGASLGLAATLPAAQALSIFAALGLGMALPYLAASAWPGVARALPKPGAWMSYFRTLMAFPMFATVVWLVWVLGQQVGIDGAAALLGTLVALAFVTWALGSPELGPRARAGFGVLSIVIFGAALLWAVPSLRSDAIAAPTSGSAEQTWQPWSAERVSEAIARGQPVFVDFTAAWCVTCQYNKRTVLSDDQVLADLKAKRVLLLRADWTRRDAAITEELARMGRNGVPVYVLHAPGTAQPRLLNEILSVHEMRDALASLP